ncbi:MAG TPA: BTAD domain-containing putative transcriptional regulator [Gemmatimonadaceae bacterium]|nr:BTAD domain-containing putative transcriptional regulator [Gemmatimonadaceae bacterium]
MTLLAPNGTEDPSLGTRRRKLAVLAYLALRARPSTRDQLATMFWGGKDDERARNSLSDALSHLRRVLGRETLVTQGDEVCLATNTGLVVDALELSEAVEAQDWGRATTLYGGSFLEGVHVDDALEFEQWSAAEGERLRRLFTRACAPLALTLVKVQDWEGCADLAARWLAAEPASTQAALYRLNALKAPGTTAALAAALAEYERLRTRLAEDLGIGLDAAVDRLAACIRAELPPVVSSLPAAPQMRIASAHATPPAVTPHPAYAVADAPVRRVPSTLLHTWRRFAALLAVIVAIVGAAAYGTRHTTAEARPVLVVLPFENLGAPGDAYFADGLTDEVRARLTEISGIRVIGGTSARQYKGTTKAPRDIARELGATYLLTASVRWERTPAGGRVRVSPELVRATDQANVWAEPVEGRLEDVFEMQARVAERVAAALDVALLAHEQRSVIAHPTTNLAAHDAYLRGLASITRTSVFSAAARRATEAEFQRAIALDSTFAAAYAQLAKSYLHELSQGGDSAAMVAARDRARAAVQRAWALDSMDVEVRLARARYFFETDDRPACERTVRAAARDAPNNVDVVEMLGEVEESAGRFEAAVEVYQRATMLDPRSVEAWSSLGGSLDNLRRYEESIAAREREIGLVPNHEVAYAAQASIYLLWRGDTATARRTLERASPALPWVTRLPGGIAGNAVWTHVLPPAVLRARDTLTLAGYLAGAGGIAPELYHLMKLRHYLQRGRAELARAQADSLVSELEPALQRGSDMKWFFGWFSRRSLLAEAYATLGRGAEAGRQTDLYVEEAREPLRTGRITANFQLCHALHNAAYVDALVGRKDVAVARLSEALRLPCGVRVSRALLRIEPSWSPLRGYAPFETLLSARD